MSNQGTGRTTRQLLTTISIAAAGARLVYVTESEQDRSVLWQYAQELAQDCGHATDLGDRVLLLDKGAIEFAVYAEGQVPSDTVIFDHCVTSALEALATQTAKDIALRQIAELMFEHDITPTDILPEVTSE